MRRVQRLHQQQVRGQKRQQPVRVQQREPVRVRERGLLFATSDQSGGHQGGQEE